MAIVEIYSLSHPETGEIRYIGKAKDAQKRLKSHIRDSRRRNTPLYTWMRKLLKEGLTPIVSVIEMTDEIAWKETEKRLIKEYKATHSLTNLAEGGDEPFCPPEVRSKNGSRLKKWRESLSEKDFKIYTLKRELMSGASKGYMSESCKEKLRELGRRDARFTCFLKL